MCTAICRHFNAMSRIFTFFLLYTFITASYSRYFDVCPSRKISIGGCLAGLCPLGSECINNYCCRDRIATTTTKMPGTPEVEEFGKCKDGQSAIGECVSKLCPSGYLCEEDLCCGNKTTTAHPPSPESTTTYTVRAKTFTPSTPFPTTSVDPTAPATTESIEIMEIVDSTTEPEEDINSTTPETDSSEDSDEEEEEATSPAIATTTVDMTEIESIRNSFRVLKSKESMETIEEDMETTTPKIVDYEVTDEEMEVGGVRTTLTTTQESMTTTHEAFTRPAWKTTTETIVVTTPEQIQICPIGESIGECISDQCPEGHTCFRNSCCIITPQINCTDTLKGCLPHLCDKRGYKEFTTSNCAKTCARCHVSELTSLDLIGCRDRRSDCKEWAAEGFCESSLYSVRQKLRFCGQSCKLC
ncbi:hypothetical protein Aduo_019751 [Ancylostoma duodenale]